MGPGRQVKSCIERTTERNFFRFIAVLESGQPVAYHPRPDVEAPRALPLSGVEERMLREGGHYRPRSDLYLTKGRRPTDPPWFRGVPRRPREYEYYPGEFVVEPDPNVSNDRTTGHLIRVMLLRGWSRNQIAYEMSLVRNKGGAWLRWQRDSDRALDRFVEGTKLPERNPPIPSPKEEAVVRPSGLVIVPGIALRFLDFIETEPRSMTDLVERGPMKDSRNGRGVAREYVDYLTEEGMIRWVPGWRTRPRGPVPNFLAVVVHPDPEA